MLERFNSNQGHVAIIGLGYVGLPLSIAFIDMATQADAVLIVTDHDAVDYAQLADMADLIVDTRNAMAAFDGKATIVKA